MDDITEIEYFTQVAAEIENRHAGNPQVTDDLAYVLFAIDPSAGRDARDTCLTVDIAEAVRKATKVKLVPDDPTRLSTGSAWERVFTDAFFKLVGKYGHQNVGAALTYMGMCLDKKPSDGDDEPSVDWNGFRALLRGKAVLANVRK
jgi:hypothetical protein